MCTTSKANDPGAARAASPAVAGRRHAPLDRAIALGACLLAASVTVSADPLWICKDPGGVERWIANAGASAPEGHCTRQQESRWLTAKAAASPARPVARTESRHVASAAANTPRGPDWTVSTQAQRARDSDSRMILEEEVAREMLRLSQLRQDTNRTPQSLKAIQRSEQDLAALQRELARLR